MDNEEKPDEKREILSHVLWIFRQERFQSKEGFSERVRQYQIDIRGENTWQPDEIVFGEPKIKILLDMDWQMPPDDRVEFALESENSTNFTALDLLFQLNNFVAEYDLGDSHFFEGLTYQPENDQYIVNLGS